MKNRNRTALITGSGGGIGAAVARALDAQGFHLVLVDRDQQANRRLAMTLESVEMVTLDLTNREELKAFCRQIPNYEVDVAFINAGMIHPGDVIDIPDKMIDLQLEINLRSAIILNKAIGEDMKSRKDMGQYHMGKKLKRSIISTVSAGALVGLKSSATYSATKYGLRGFLMAFHSEMKEYDVQVSGIYPAAVDTPMLRYEASNGGSVLNFLGTPRTTDDIVNGFMKAMKTGKLEVHIPHADSVLPRILGGVFPGLVSRLYPLMEYLGTKGRDKYLKKVQSEGRFTRYNIAT